MRWARQTTPAFLFVFASAATTCPLSSALAHDRPSRFLPPPDSGFKPPPDSGFKPPGQPEKPPAYPRPPSVEVPLPEAKTEAYVPPRWNWEHWWEANRERYLFTPDTTPAKARQARAARFRRDLDSARPEVVEALRRVFSSGDAEARAAAAFAVGRGGFHELIEELARAVGDPQPEVRRAALLATGLLRGGAARQQLLAQPFDAATAAWSEAGVIALCWLEKPDGRITEALKKQLRSTTHELMRFPAWSIGFHPDRDVNEMMRTIVTGNTDFRSAGMAMLAAGRNADPKSLDLLRRIAGGADVCQDLAAWLEGVRKSQEEEAPAHVEPRRTVRPSQRPGPRPSAPTVVREKHVHVAHLAQLRGSAAIALGLANDVGAEPYLISALGEKDTLYTPLFKGFVCITLGRVGGPEAAVALERTLRTETPGREFPTDRRGTYNPVRACSAIGLALLAGRHGTAAGAVPPAVASAASEALLAALANPDETVEVRSAAAVGLGLARRREAIPVIRRVVTEALERELNPKLVGYCMVTLGMLGDEAYVLRTAHDLLKRIKQYRRFEDVVTGRALMLGVGLTRSAEATGILRFGLHGMYYVRREAVLGVSLCQDGSLIQDILPLFGGDESDAIFAAEALGQIYDSERVELHPSACRLLLEDTNYQFRDEEMLGNALHVNEFLFRVLEWLAANTSWR